MKGYPTLKFFKDGVAQVSSGGVFMTATPPKEYTGGRTSDTIVAWLTKKSSGIPSLATKVPRPPGTFLTSLRMPPMP